MRRNDAKRYKGLTPAEHIAVGEHIKLAVVEIEAVHCKLLAAYGPRFEGECSGALAELNKLRHGLQSMLAIEVGMQTKLGMVTREKHFMDVYFGIQPEVKEIRASD